MALDENVDSVLERVSQHGRYLLDGFQTVCVESSGSLVSGCRKHFESVPEIAEGSSFVLVAEVGATALAAEALARHTEET